MPKNPELHGSRCQISGPYRRHFKYSDGWWTSRLLARVLKEGVQFWYNDTSTVKSGEGENVPLENL
jgi:hypothetical protein